MTRRYNCLKLTLLTAALLAGMKPTTLSAQGACCFQEPADVANAKNAVFVVFYYCNDTRGGTDCPTWFGSDTGEYLGDGTVCGVNGPYDGLVSCRADATGLPVEIISFDALVKDDEVILTWLTASESNNAGYSVEQAVGSDVFGEIGYVDGHGTTIEPMQYSFAASDLDPGLHRFRLKQIDYDGAFEYSAIVEAAVTVPDRFLIEPAYPNPFNPTTTLRFAVAAEQHIEVTLVNSAGQSIRTLYSGTVAANEMRHLIVNAEALPSGTYLVRLEGDTGLSATERIVLMK